MKKLGFGAMRLPLTDAADQTAIDMEQVCQMVDSFLDQGFTYFDTAYMYHNYASERVLRKALVERHPRDSYTIATKLPTMMLKEPEDQPRIFNEQMEKLGVDYFDYYLLHCLNQENYATAQRLDSFGFQSQMKKEGKIRKMGFSFHDSPELLDQILTEHPEVEFVQLQLNYLDWDSVSVQSRRCQEVCVRHGKPIVVMEPVKGGTLAKVPAAAEALMKAAEPEMSVASWAVRYAASQENVFMVLSGMSNLNQMLDNTSYMRDFRPLTAEETAMLRQVTRIIQEDMRVPCTACRYCTEGCPKQIAIPDYFALYNQSLREGRPSDDTLAQYRSFQQEQGKGKASDCIACRQCERHCPQHIYIVDQLKAVAKQLEG
ncbi:MAG: aldo/keto reductase [Clostridiales bacterium]|nr:aldo/keto reductase [Clostridiales bacterium]